MGCVGATGAESVPQTVARSCRNVLSCVLDHRLRKDGQTNSTRSHHPSHVACHPCILVPYVEDFSVTHHPSRKGRQYGPIEKERERNGIQRLNLSTAPIHHVSMRQSSPISLLLATMLTVAHSFAPNCRSPANLVALHSTAFGRPRSRVTDPTGPTLTIEDDEVDTIDAEDIPELHYDPDKHPIPHQPWRRGETAGCEDPIDAEWRQQAENIIQKAVEMTGGEIVDVTWFLTHLVVTVDESMTGVQRDLLKTSGPVINVQEPESPMYRDPADPNPEDIWADDDDDAIIYEKDEETEDDVKSKMYARQEDGEDDLELDEDGDIPLYSSQESREDDALRVAEEAEMIEERQERPLNIEALKIDTAALSLIAGAIIDALETVEEELQVLARHEIVLTSPGAPDVLETQSQFDAHRGYDVAVETQDPWESNRTLRGKLLDRNSMDVIINQKGRMVTVPLNFVKCVRLPHVQGSKEVTMESSAAEDLGEQEDIYK